MSGRIGIPGGRAGVGGLGFIAVVVVALLLGVDPRSCFRATSATPPSAYVPQRSDAGAGGQAEGLRVVVLADTEDTWHEQFRTLECELREPEAGALYRGRRVRLRFRSIGHGALLLPL